MKTRGLLIVIITALTTLTKVLAATYSLEPIADARVLGLPGDQNANYRGDILSCYTESSTINTQRTFIQFDLSSIAVSSTQQVQSATLTLIAGTQFGTNTGFQPMQIYRVTSPWSEGSLTWSNRDTTHLWTNSGGDFVGVGGQPYSVSTASPTNGGPVTWDITALVQEWVSHSNANYGLLLKSENGNHLIFYQREYPITNVHPNLTVVVGGGLPPLQVSRGGGQIVVSWTTAGNVLQEKTNLSPAISWQDSGRSVSQLNGTNSVTISSPTGNNFFRLRSGP